VVFLVVGLPMACAPLLVRRRAPANEDDPLDAEKRAGRAETLTIFGLMFVAVAVQGIGREVARLVN